MGLEDGGESWVQLAWEQPAPDQFGVPGALGGCCIPSVAVGPESARWFVDRNPRFLADITGDGRADIVGFGDTGVWTAISNGDGTFQPPRVVLADFCLQAGGWRVEKHPRFLADITGDGRADIVGFGDAGVWTALSNGDGTFQAPRFVLADLGFEAGGWRVEKHPRFLADITGDGRADIVGFGDAGVWTALSNGDGTFQAPQFVLADLGFEAGGWRVEKHPRFLADITGDGRADIVGFGDAGVWTALSNGDGTFQAPTFVLADLGFEAGGWRVEKHPRFLADITGDRRADIVGFGDAGVWTALSNGDGTFQAPRFVLADLGFEAGGWRVEKHPRFLADITGDGRADIVGLRRRRRVDGAEQRRWDVPGAAVRAGRPRLRGRAAGGWRSTRASSPTSPATAGPTSSASAMPGCMWRWQTPTASSRHRCGSCCRTSATC